MKHKALEKIMAWLVIIALSGVVVFETGGDEPTTNTFPETILPR